MKLGVILGSGMDNIEQYYHSINVISTENKGIHNKKIFTGKNDAGNKILFFCGRKHFYEGYKYEELISNIEYAKDSGLSHLLITNAAGGVNKVYNTSELMLINSYINFNLNISKKLIKFRQDEIFTNFIIKTARTANVKIHKGTYGYFSGPAYETSAEIRYLRKYGIDAAGMSTIPEISESIKKGIKVLAISVITNLLKENTISNPDHLSVIKNASKTTFNLSLLINALSNELKKS